MQHYSAALNKPLVVALEFCLTLVVSNCLADGV